MIRPEVRPLFDALPGLIKRAEEFLKETELNIKINVISDSWADPGIEFGDTGVGVVISFDREDNVEFRAYAATSYPGVWRYPDGSGEPPGADIIELGKSNKNLDYPLIDALKAAIEVRISRYLDAGAEV